MIHDLENQFDQRNLFLLVTLGLISMAERIEHALLADAPALEVAVESRDSDRLVDLALGLLSFSGTVLRHGRQAASTAPPLVGSKLQVAALNSRGLLAL